MPLVLVTRVRDAGARASAGRCHLPAAAFAAKVGEREIDGDVGLPDGQCTALPKSCAQRWPAGPGSQRDRASSSWPGRPPGGPLLRRWWCDARVTALVLAQPGTALRAVHLGRTLTGPERRAALTQTGNRCAGTGCCPVTPNPSIVFRPPITSAATPTPAAPAWMTP